MKTIREELSGVVDEFDYYRDESQREDQRRIVVKFLAEFYGVPESDVDASLENNVIGQEI